MMPNIFDLLLGLYASNITNTIIYFLIIGPMVSMDRVDF